MKIALAQMKMAQDMETNYKKAVDLIEAAAKKGAELICFPEVQLTPFFPQYQGKNAAELAVRLDGAYVKGICAACKEHQIYASPNFYIEENGKRYDMSLLIDENGEIIGKQKMVHITQAEKFYEQDYYTPSEEGFQVFDTKLGKIGVVVCFDRHYPESIRSSALNGAELVIVPTANTKDEPLELFQWEIKIQAFQSVVNIAMCNRVGLEDEMDFCGESIVSDYNGNTIALADDSEMLLFAEVDMPGAMAMRSKKSYTNLRRTELYR